MRVAMRRNGTLTYLHSDHLGSTVLETNTSGSASADMKYRAYGNQRDSGPVVTDHKFTGQKLDGTGLYYYNARYYDPTLGAFISPDTIVPDAMNVLSYNRYLYTRGNPLKFSDPTGHIEFCVEASACGVGGTISGGGGGGRFQMSGGAGGNAKSTAQLVSDIVAITVGANAVIDGFQESVPIAAPERAEVQGVPLDNQTPAVGWPTSFELPGQQVWADPLPTVEMGSNIVDSSWLGENVKIQGVGSSGNTKGYTRATTDLSGGLAGAIEAYEALTGSLPQINNPQSLAPTDFYIEVGKIEVYFRPTSRSGTAVLEIIDHGNKTNEKIHFN